VAIYLVRHAHAGDKRLWHRPDQVRPLSRLGWQEVTGLTALLTGVPIAAVLSSPALRCVQTVRALAADRRLPVCTDGRLDRAADATDLLAVIAEQPAHRDTLLCSHGEGIGALLLRLRRDGLVLPGDAVWPKGSTWILDAPAGVVTAARYLPPCRPEPAQLGTLGPAAGASALG
jgi:8-oxo-dGTP diphosphatase